jgi:hypothetical protein
MSPYREVFGLSEVIPPETERSIILEEIAA